MKSLTTINMNYNKALAQASRLEELASQLERESSGNLEEALQTVRRNWQGENADAYLAKGQRLQEKIRDSAKNLRTTASTVRTIAKAVYDAEKRAYDIAMRRTYK